MDLGNEVIPLTRFIREQRVFERFSRLIPEWGKGVTINSLFFILPLVNA
jgi:hypothetical protein